MQKETEIQNIFTKQSRKEGDKLKSSISYGKGKVLMIPKKLAKHYSYIVKLSLVKLQRTFFSPVVI